MYSVHAYPLPAMANAGIGNGLMDPSGTIDPSALNAAGTCARPHLSRRRDVAQPHQTRARRRRDWLARPLHPSREC
jgi:hypothetical protein